MSTPAACLPGPPFCPAHLTAEWQEAAAALYDPAPLVASPERDPSAAALAERAKGGGKGATLADCLEVRSSSYGIPLGMNAAGRALVEQMEADGGSALYGTASDAGARNGAAGPPGGPHPPGR